jgi:AAA+ superfamily predicted ATPase
MTPSELLICSGEIAGYALHEKKWGHFKVDHLEEIDYDTGAIDQLVLNEDAKHHVCSLVQSHEEETGGFDDIIIRKGFGMIFLFHGEPGVGKTLMAGKSNRSSADD